MTPVEFRDRLLAQPLDPSGHTQDLRVANGVPQRIFAVRSEVAIGNYHALIDAACALYESGISQAIETARAEERARIWRRLGRLSRTDNVAPDFHLFVELAQPLRDKLARIIKALRLRDRQGRKKAHELACKEEECRRLTAMLIGKVRDFRSRGTREDCVTPEPKDSGGER
jgi:hypothetical protein